ncbi:hypothetical protein BDZ97DRAFT_696992 [Flammula alnicola]|nr:hypothetical protein BDZ97DRAFT_696992 [Flammula alnicola]
MPLASPSPSYLLPIDNANHGLGVQDCEVPRITIERASTPLSSSSRYSSEPLDTELWDRRSVYLDTLYLDTVASDSSSYASSFHSQPFSPPVSRPISPRAMEANENPPDYIATVQRPTAPVKYNFSSISYSSMIVAPNSEAEDSPPKYHISISMNCFMPLNHITTIRRGGSGYGELVAQFEMGIAGSPSTVTIEGKELLIGSLLSKRLGSRQSGLWFWIPPDSKKRLLWDYRQTPFICRSLLKIGSGAEASTLATFTPARQVPAGGPPVLAELTVTPLGQDFFDDLLLSLLIIERRRLTPGKDRVLKQLFN